VTLEEERVAEFYAFMVERESIRLRRLRGLPRGSWTDDEIFRAYRFTNVRREHDRTTMMLQKHFYGPNLARERDRRELLLNCATARYVGRWDTVAEIGWQSTIDEAVSRITALGDASRIRFTSAYIIPSCSRSELKYVVVCDILKSLWDAFPEMLTYPDWQSWTSVLTKCYGCGSFMAKELLLDYIQTTGEKPTDWETWTPVGPGGCRGAGWVLTGKKEKLPEKLALEVILETYAARGRHWPSEIEGVKSVDLDPHAIQFAKCEWAKYLLAKHLGRMPKRRFDKPVTDEVTRDA
jgi:hypothetical protein